MEILLMKFTQFSLCKLIIKEPNFANAEFGSLNLKYFSNIIYTPFTMFYTLGIEGRILSYTFE